jgi:hypothetical protein
VPVVVVSVPVELEDISPVEDVSVVPPSPLVVSPPDVLEVVVAGSGVDCGSVQ